MRLSPFAVFLFVLVSSLSAQTLPGQTGTLVGHVTDSAGVVIPGAFVRLAEQPYATRTRDDGSFRFTSLPAVSYHLQVTQFGFASESTTVVVAANGTTECAIKLHAVALSLERVLVVAPRMGETQAAALGAQKAADNLISVMPGDVIRALPNYNAAEATGRMGDVSLERDEGEGKFVQIRGTEPRLSSVTVDGVLVPGTEVGSRITKLDDVPSDLLGAIIISKTLTADMDAEAIGGSVDLETKTPEGAPRGYLSGQFGHITLETRDVGQGGMTWGGRFGADQRLGFLIGGSIDRTNRPINDVEPAWGVDSTGRSYPLEWSQRNYDYFRNRYGIGGDLDYRFSDSSRIYLKGLWSLFQNHGDTYVYDIATNGDSAGVGPVGFGTNAALTREVYIRVPDEQLWGLKAGGQQEFSAWSVDYALNLAGTEQSITDYRFNPFVYAPSGPNSLTLGYNASNTQLPLYSYMSAAEQTAAFTTSNYALTGYSADNELTTGRNFGGQLNFTRGWTLASDPSTLKFGLRYRDESKSYSQGNVNYGYSGGAPYTLDQAVSGLTDPNFYQSLGGSSFAMGPVPNPSAVVPWEYAHPTMFTNNTDTIGNALASFTGTEQVAAAYLMNTVDLGAFHVNVGVRVEVTHSNYTGNVAATDTATGVTSLSLVSGTQDYTDVFPSVNVRYGIDENTNLRAAVTRGIARPNYGDLAPSLQGNLGAIYQHTYANLSAGNPDLQPQHAWNYDLLFEHYMPSSGGMLSGGVFYKSLTDVILTRNFVYSGPFTAFDGYYGTEPSNGGSGHLVGIEAAWVQHFPFLPGLLSGLGVDLNYMHASSQVVVDQTGRVAPLLRQAPDIGNAALLYDRGPVSFRMGWTYNAAYIFSYGDGSATANGDTYMYEHSQIDASLIYTLSPTIAIQVQGLDLNNAQFGFFQGNLDHRYDIQREYYGETFYIGMKYGF